MINLLRVLRAVLHRPPPTRPPTDAERMADEARRMSRNFRELRRKEREAQRTTRHVD